jgi:RHS repeat-associated protein
VAETDGAGNVTALFVYATKGNVPDYILSAGATYRVFTDHLGSVRMVVDVQSGALLQQIDYDAFGRIIFDSNPGAQPCGFAGGLYDAQTGLTRFGARDYDPEVGRWTSKDPVGFAGGSAGLYSYANNDSVNLVDPTGLDDTELGPGAGVPIVDFLGYMKRGLSQLGENALDTISEILDALDPPKESFCLPAPDGDGEICGEASYGIMPITPGSAMQLVESLPEVSELASGSARSGFRRALIRLTGAAEEGAHAHHMFPVAFRERFVRAGINIRDPHFGAWWEATEHLSSASGYNEAWRQFLRSDPTRDEILAFGRELAAKYGLTIHY